MANPTTNYGWPMPTSTDLVTDLPADFALFGQPVDTSLKALNPGTTLGDLAYSSATANTNTRLGIGSTSQVLTVSGGVPVWATAPSGGMTSIASGTLSGASVVLSSISGSYNSLTLIVRNYKPANDGTFLKLRLNGLTTATYYYADTNTVTNNGFTDTSIGFAASGADNTTANGLQIINIDDYANATTWKIVEGVSITNNATTSANFNYERTIGLHNQTAAITSITLLNNAGNFTSGDYILYGVK